MTPKSLLTPNFLPKLHEVISSSSEIQCKKHFRMLFVQLYITQVHQVKGHDLQPIWLDDVVIYKMQYEAQ